jgi:membrane protein DedA with SNARE-associated domain
MLGHARLTLGHTFGNVVYIFVTDVKGYEKPIVPVVIALAVMAIILYRYFVRKTRGDRVWKFENARFKRNLN